LLHAILREFDLGSGDAQREHHLLLGGFTLRALPSLLTLVNDAANDENAEHESGSPSQTWHNE